jgi:hypothetical protein
LLLDVGSESLLAGFKEVRKGWRYAGNDPSHDGVGRFACLVGSTGGGPGEFEEASY